MEAEPVSARDNSFKSRGVTGHYLNTILAQIRRPLVANNAYHVIGTDESVEDTITNIVDNTSLKDPYFDMIVMHRRDRNQMPETEAVFYYIRNSFAHGSFETRTVENNTYYYLESGQKGTVKARMRLRESTLMEYARLSRLSKEDIKLLQRHKK